MICRNTASALQLVRRCNYSRAEAEAALTGPHLPSLAELLRHRLVNVTLCPQQRVYLSQTGELELGAWQQAPQIHL